MLVGDAASSTDLQTTECQIDALHAVGYERMFKEWMSDTRTDRPQLAAAALEFAYKGDVLVVARLDPCARFCPPWTPCRARGIGLRSLRDNIDATSATGRPGD